MKLIVMLLSVVGHALTDLIFWLYLPCDGVHGLLPHLSIAQGLVGVSYILVVSDFLLSPEWKTTHITYNNSPHTMTLVIML